MNRRTSSGTDLESVAFDLAWLPSHEIELVNGRLILNFLRHGMMMGATSKNSKAMLQVVTSALPFKIKVVCSDWLTIPDLTSRSTG